MSEVLDPVKNYTKLDKVERLIQDLENPIDLPVTHRFTPGMYIREIFMPAGTLVTSKIHKTEHPFVVTQGVATVYNAENDKTVQIAAPHFGITKPGTRRLLYIHEDCIWITFHATNLTDPDEIEEQIIEKYHNPLLAAGNNELLSAAVKEIA